jgi:NTP pyrophosphatase (non-canonical NTP hydrolase)
MANYANLRDANIARQAEWDTGNQLDFSWRCNELAGEAGEVCNVLKKLHRERLGIIGSRATKDDLADELADVMICVDLVGMHENLPTLGSGPMMIYDPNRRSAYTSLTDAGNALSARVGKVSSIIFEAPGDRNILHRALANVVKCVVEIAVMEQIDLRVAVAKKFNETTHKVSLTTFLRLED